MRHGDMANHTRLSISAYAAHFRRRGMHSNQGITSAAFFHAAGKAMIFVSCQLMMPLSVARSRPAVYLPGAGIDIIEPRRNHQT